MASSVSKTNPCQAIASPDFLIQVREMEASTSDDGFKRELVFYIDGNNEVSVDMYGYAWRDEKGTNHSRERKFLGTINDCSISFAVEDRGLRLSYEEKRSILENLDPDTVEFGYSFNKEVSRMVIYS